MHGHGRAGRSQLSSTASTKIGNIYSTKYFTDVTGSMLCSICGTNIPTAWGMHF